MNAFTTKNSNLDPSGTSFWGTEVSATLNELREILGQPTSEENNGMDKVNVEFIRSFYHNGIRKVFTVYDWKYYRPIEESELIDWHIGAKSEETTIFAKTEIERALQNIRSKK